MDNTPYDDSFGAVSLTMNHWSVSYYVPKTVQPEVKVLRSHFLPKMPRWFLLQWA